jgi:hypothetical protein
VGASVGDSFDGEPVGVTVVGASVWTGVGIELELAIGEVVGLLDGCAVGNSVGASVGRDVGYVLHGLQ